MSCVYCLTYPLVVKRFILETLSNGVLGYIITDSIETCSFTVIVSDASGGYFGLVFTTPFSLKIIYLFYWLVLATIWLNLILGDMYNRYVCCL